MKRTYDWVPGNLPRNWPYTAHRDGWTRWYRGRTIFVCGKGTPLAEVENYWIARKAKVDREDAPVVSGPMLLHQAASLYYDWLDLRVRSGIPEPMAPATASDYKRTINSFGRFSLAGRKFATMPLSEFNQPEFAAFARTFDGSAPSSFARAVAYISAFFRWCADEGHMTSPPQYGRFFVRPSQADHDDKRIAEAKCYTAADLYRLVFHASIEEVAWIGLGLGGALDNSDIAHLTFDVLDRKAGTIDYRRRKRGKVRRVIPVPPFVWRWVDQYDRPKPADAASADLVFLTPTGLPLQRLVPGIAGQSNPIDYVAMRWTRLMIRAGLREPLPKRAKAGEARERRYKAKGSAAGQGFRALRTTFPNLAPPGYRDEVELVMGHAGGVLVDSYLERFGLSRLWELVDHVWRSAFTEA